MKRLLLTSTLILAFNRDVHADLRSFTETYEYSTVPQGRTSVELWHTQGRTSFDADSPQFIENIVEVEHGITDRLSLAFYTIIEQVAGDAMTGEPLHFSEVKVE